MTAGAVGVPTIVPLRAPIPGQHKTAIDTATKIELRSETPGATIYYTINGAKPEPFQKVGPAAVNTFRYKEPFFVSGGKRTLKAIAVAEDGLRESHVVTKTFDVEQLDNDPKRTQDNGYNFVGDIPVTTDYAKKEVRKFAHKMVTSKQAWDEMQKMRDTEDMMAEMAMHGSNRRKPQTGTRFMNNRMGGSIRSDQVTIGNDSTLAHTVNGTLEDQFIRSKRMLPDTATQALRLQRETDFLKCIYCFSPRPSDPYARFCNECGNPCPPLPQSRMPPPEAGQMGTCVSCKSLVPFNTASCLVCEAPIGPQNQPMASIRLADKTVCVVCGTANPINITNCLTCEERLPVGPPRPVNHGMSAPPLPKEDGRLVACNKCSRVNNPDARYCDWCGSKPSPNMACLVCSKCTASNQPYAKHCGSCGITLEPPQRNDYRNGGMPVNRNAQNQWMPVNLPNNPVPKCDAAAQTVGLFFPSQREISKKQQEEEDKLAQEKMMRDRQPLLTAISPGRGYWRKQMDHVSSHLKAYAQNNPEFRALVGEPRMGKMISATVHEDGHELSLTINFALRGNDDPFVGKQMGVTRELMSSYTNGRLRSYGSQDSLSKSSKKQAQNSTDNLSGGSTARSKTRKRSARRAKKRQPQDNKDERSSEDRQLLKELGKNGEGRPSEIQQLIDEGADPNVLNKDGVPALHIAAVNKQIDAIPILIQEGADPNKKGPNKGNTALHEVITLGSGGMEVIDTLIDSGANPQKKNDKGETPYDLAVKGGYETVANRFTASLGQSALGKLIKPKSTVKDEDY